MYECLLWFWGPGLRMLCVRSMRNTEARPDCSQPAIQAFTVQPYTQTPRFPPPTPHPIPGPQKPKPRLPKHCQKMFPRSSVPAVYWHDLAGCLALIYKYKYISVCVCVFLCVGAYVMRSCSGTDSVFRKSQE
jgi:hypothetical protein